MKCLREKGEDDVESVVRAEVLSESMVYTYVDGALGKLPHDWASRSTEYR